MPGFPVQFSTACLTALLALVSVYSPAEPALSVVEQPSAGVLHEPLSLVFEVTWEGDPAEYVTVAPSLALDSWGEVQGIETTSSPTDNGATFRHTITLIPSEIGEFTTPELQFPYIAKANLPEMPPPGPEAAEVPTPEYQYLLASPFTITVSEASDSTLTLMGFLVLGTFMFASAYVFYRRNAVRLATSGEVVTQSVPSYIHEARKHRLDDDYYQFYQNLVEGVSLLRESDEKHRLHRSFTDRAMAVGYKGAKVTEDELDGALRDLERAHADDRKHGHSS